MTKEPKKMRINDQDDDGDDYYDQTYEYLKKDRFYDGPDVKTLKTRLEERTVTVRKINLAKNQEDKYNYYIIESSDGYHTIARLPKRGEEEEQL